MWLCSKSESNRIANLRSKNYSSVLQEKREVTNQSDTSREPASCGNAKSCTVFVSVVVKVNHCFLKCKCIQCLAIPYCTEIGYRDTVWSPLIRVTNNVSTALLWLPDSNDPLSKSAKTKTRTKPIKNSYATEKQSHHAVLKPRKGRWSALLRVRRRSYGNPWEFQLQRRQLHTIPKSRVPVSRHPYKISQCQRNWAEWARAVSSGSVVRSSLHKRTKTITKQTKSLRYFQSPCRNCKWRWSCFL
jgi:hypothetical protein